MCIKRSRNPAAWFINSRDLRNWRNWLYQITFSRYAHYRHLTMMLTLGLPRIQSKDFQQLWFWREVVNTAGMKLQRLSDDPLRRTPQVMILNCLTSRIYWRHYPSNCTPLGFELIELSLAVACKHHLSMEKGNNGRVSHQPTKAGKDKENLKSTFRKRSGWELGDNDVRLPSKKVKGYLRAERTMLARV